MSWPGVVCDRNHGFAPTTPSNKSQNTEKSSDHPTDSGPFVRLGYARDDPIQVAGEWRADNAQELRERLNLPTGSSPAAILTAGWGRWKYGLADRLRGPFAIVLFDRSTRECYCARDVFGMLPLVYAVQNDKLILADRSSKVRRLSGVPHSINPAMIAEFLDGEWRSKDATYYKGVTRLRPAHFMVATPTGLSHERYWHPSNLPRNQHIPDAAQQFRALFDRSVRRCHVEGQTALALSGGLDSGAIAGSIAAMDPAAKPPAISLTYRDNDAWTDGKHLDDLRDTLGFAGHELPSTMHDPLGDLERYLVALDGPYLSYGSSVATQLHRLTANLGHRFMLSGNGGDEIVSYGLGRLNELARSGRWWRLWRESQGATRLHGSTRADTFRRYLVHLDRYPGGGRVVRRLTRQRAAMTAPPRNLSSEALRSDSDCERESLPNPLSHRDHDDRVVQEWMLDHPLQAKSLEMFAVTSEADGIRTVMPFYDRELVELSLSLPSDEKLKDGETRVILRRAMAGALPPSIGARGDKFDFSSVFIRGLVARPERLLDLTNPECRALKPYVDVDELTRLRALVTNDPATIPSVDAFALWRAAVLSMWLERA